MQQVKHKTYRKKIITFYEENQQDVKNGKMFQAVQMYHKNPNSLQTKYKYNTIPVKLLTSLHC